MPTRDGGGTVEFAAPPCPLCSEELDADPDGFHCQHCEAMWDTTGEFYGWDNPDAPQCESTTWNHWNKKSFQCVLAAGHDADQGSPSFHKHPTLSPWKIPHLPPVDDKPVPVPDDVILGFDATRVRRGDGSW